jgi:chitinase
MLTGFSPAHTTPKRDVVAYVFPQNRTLAANEIAAEKVTRINYAFANIAKGNMVEGFPHDAENFAVLTGLKRLNPDLQVLISVGGWSWSGGFSDMALTQETRATFIESAAGFINKYGLDGIDIDWEYPGLPGAGNVNRPEDDQNYTALMKELRARLDSEGKQHGHRLLLSVAAGASAQFLAHTEMKKMQRYVDSVNLMSYDYYEPTSDQITGHHAPLYTNPADPKHVSVDASVQAFEAAGVPARKIVLGIPFYGHAWSQVPPASNGLFKAGRKADLPADYRSIAESLLTSGFALYWDPVSSVPYLYNSATQTFVSYEDPQSIRLKCRYVLQHKLAGVMFWEYGNDLNGALLNAIDSALKNGR